MIGVMWGRECTIVNPRPDRTQPHFHANKLRPPVPELINIMLAVNQAMQHKFIS
jgi:hypothetical protein